MSPANETPDLRWFEAFPKCCMCGKPSAGLLRGSADADYGHHCKRCAERRLKDSARVRDAIAKHAPR